MKISAMTFDGTYWSGWSNKKEEQIPSLESAFQKVMEDPEEGFFIIDADNLKIYVSDMIYVERAIKSAKVNWNVDIPVENVYLYQ